VWLLPLALVRNSSAASCFVLATAIGQSRVACRIQPHQNWGTYPDRRTLDCTMLQCQSRYSSSLLSVHAHLFLTMGSTDIYEDLDSSERQIRLLHLLPGSWEEPICCSLQVVSLDDKPLYQGLSYAWGKLNFVNTIQVNKRPCPITANLWTALRRLRRTKHERVLWIDAISINQRNLDERSYQVSLMGEIFSSASEIMIWLGDSISKSSSLQSSPVVLEDGKDIQWLRENIGKICSMTSFLNHESETLAAFGMLYLLSIDEHWTEKPLFKADDKGQLHIANAYKLAWQALQKMLRLQWWTRLWVVQEFVLSREATLALGSVSVPGELLYDFCRSYLKHNLPGACCHFSATWKISPEVWQDIVSIRLTPLTFFNLQLGRSQMMYSTQDKSMAVSPFLEHLWLLRHKAATDPKDKIYALLGLMQGQNDLLLIPDYTLSIAETFARATSALIKSDGNLNALIGPRLHRPDMPSWVMDLLPAENAGSVLFFQNILKRIKWCNVFNACGLHKLRYTLKTGTLELRGIRVDQVSETAAAWEEGSVAQPFIAWEKLADCSSKKVYPSACTKAEAFWRSMLRDTIRVHQKDSETIRRANDSDDSTYQCFRKWLIGDEEAKDQNLTASPGFADIRKSFFIATKGQDFFTTRQGFMGLGESVQAGDEIWVLFGGQVPFVLRPYSSDSKHVNCYYMVGDCYVHGIMHGEKVLGIQETEAQTILLA